MAKFKLSEFKTPEKHSHLLWRRFVVDPLFRFPAYLIVNYTNITPNQITFFAFLLSILQFYFFTNGSLILGALFNQLSFGLDQIDGKIARLKGLVSKSGTLMDSIIDKVRVLLGVTGLIIYFKSDFAVSILLLALLFTNMMFDFIGVFLLYRIDHVTDKAIHLDYNENKKKHHIGFSTQEQEAIVFFFAPVLYLFYKNSIYYIIGLAVILMVLYLTIRVIKAIKRYNHHKI